MVFVRGGGGGVNVCPIYTMSPSLHQVFTSCFLEVIVSNLIEYIILYVKNKNP